MESSFATSGHARVPNSWTACAKMRRSTLFRFDTSSSGVDVDLRARTAEAILLVGSSDTVEARRKDNAHIQLSKTGDASLSVAVVANTV